jgi:hypothetical protein
MDHFFNGLERVMDRINSFFVLIGAIMLVGSFYAILF